MTKYIGVVVVFSFLSLTLQCKGQSDEQESKEQKERYTYKKGDPNGIGKWYMGREIAHVMGFQGIGWLERPEREAEENTATLLKNMGITEEDTIADIGAGSGYHVFKMASLARKGHIYAVDIQDEMLQAIQQKKEKIGVQNITTVKGSTESVNLPENSIDKVLMVDVYHEFDYPAEMVASMRKALRPKGRIYLIEYRSEDNSVPIKKVHKMSEKQAVREMNKAGFKLLQNIENLPWQHCLIFVKE